MSAATASPPRIDATIIGGGIAGAWLLRLLNDRGYRVALIERAALGADQTLASQGMIHGGLKYALGGQLSGASEAIAAMPERWRRCVAGDDPVDLRGVRILSEHYYMFANASTLGRLTTFFAARALRGRIEKLERPAWPSGFDGFDGVVYRLNDFVVDTGSLLASLTRDLAPRTFRHTLTGTDVQALADGFAIAAAGAQWHSRYLINCAGNGSAALLDALGITAFRVQQRPLKQVTVERAGLPPLYAHCLTGITSNEPRLTITTHPGAHGPLWYLGGRLATSGVARSDDEQVACARRELELCVPWIDWKEAQFAVYTVDRAEPLQADGHRPEQAYAAADGRFIQCFPTKLTLSPDLGDRVLALLEPPAADGPDLPPSTLPVPMGTPPWL